MAYVYEYPRAAVTVDAVLVADWGKDARLLLVRRKHAPFEGCWALPGGFLNLDETLEAACRRELEEETGLSLPALTQFRVYDAIDRDPRHRTLSVVFYALIPEPVAVSGGDDADKAAWFSIGQLPDLAFDHGEIVRDLKEFLIKLS